MQQQYLIFLATHGEKEADRLQKAVSSASGWESCRVETWANSVMFYSDTERLAEAAWVLRLSREYDRPVLLCYLVESEPVFHAGADFWASLAACIEEWKQQPTEEWWGYLLCDRGKRVDDFCTVSPQTDCGGLLSSPGAWGNAALVAGYFEVEPARIERYLCPWDMIAPDHASEFRRAYPEDDFIIGFASQAVDFLTALGYYGVLLSL